MGTVKTNLYLNSSAEGEKLHVIVWKPEVGEVKGILQLVHGMVEYINRYDAFASYMTEQGYLVIGHDQLGHGGTVKSDEDLGFFAEKDGDRIVIEDIARVAKAIKNKYPGVPHTILGHSMGSFFTRKFLTKYSSLVDGAIIMGTGSVPAAVAGFGEITAKAICLFKGKRHRSKFLWQMALGSNNKGIENPRTSNDWLSRNEENVDKYNADPLCGYMFTASAYKDFFCVMKELGQKKDFDKMDKEMPVLFIAGAEDPVGSCGKGVEQAAESFRRAGMKHVDVKLYPEDRHEILNEVDRETVFQDISSWISENVK